MTETKIALVLGTTGVTGTPFAEQLLSAGWTVYGVSRRAPMLRTATPLDKFIHLQADLQDDTSLQGALRACPDVTHIFHCANAGTGAARLRSMANLLDTVEANAPHFSNINLLQGMKYYGCHLGPFRTPAHEDDPHIGGNDFYYDEEDLIRQRQAGKSWTWTALRPHSVCGYSAGNPLNLALIIAVYASICREINEPFTFPASAGCFESQFQVMDAEILAHAAIHIASDPAYGNQVFNVSNGKPFHWKDLWPALASFFELTPADPGSLPLAGFLDRHKATWEVLAARHQLRPFPIEDAGVWVRGDYTPPHSRFSAEYDIMSDTAKIRRSGFSETIDNAAMFLRLFERYRAERIIP